MNIHHNDTENFIYNPEDFFQYFSLLLSGHGGNTLQQITTQVRTAQLDVRPKYHVFTNTKIFNYIRPVKCNVKILNGRKSPEKGFGLVIVKTIKSRIITSLWPSYYIPKKPQKKISQPSLKH